MELPLAITIVLPWLQWTIIIALTFVSGTAWCFILWVLPIIKLNRHSGTAASQLVETSHRGGLWLEPFNAGLAATLALITILLRYHPDSVEAASWKFYAAASVTLVQVAWWERVFIFPLDRAVMAMTDSGHERKVLQQQHHPQQAELQKLHRIMDLWGMYHAVRASLPFAAALIAFAGKMSLQSLY